MAHLATTISGTGATTGHVNGASRYARSKMRRYTENKYLTYEIYKRMSRTKDGHEQYMEITPAVEYRPDLVAYEIYGTPDLWWSVMEFNGMKDIMEFKAGVIILLPGHVMV